MEKELLQYLLPKDLIDNFELLSITEVSKTQEKGAHILVKLKEKNIYKFTNKKATEKIFSVAF